MTDNRNRTDHIGEPWFNQTYDPSAAGWQADYTRTRARVDYSMQDLIGRADARKIEFGADYDATVSGSTVSGVKNIVVSD
jgi:hypothetical protein